MAVDQEFLDQLVPLLESEVQPSLNLDRVRLWVEALESGNYQQGHRLLCHIEADGSEKVCCLEVANLLAAADGVPMQSMTVSCCYPLVAHDPEKRHDPHQERGYMVSPSELDWRPYDLNRSVMTDATVRWLGFQSSNPIIGRHRHGDNGSMYITAISANDASRWTFEQIAAVVRFSYLSTKPEENQPSGVQVNVWPTTNFFLNTYCGSDGALLKDFWEKIGRRYDAEDPDGWRNMLVQTFVPVMEKVIQDVVRSYSADALVGNINGVRAEAQAKIAAQFTAELKRLVGGSYFCGPSYDRRKPDCPDIEITIKDVDYADPGIQEARNAKQKAIEMAAATVAEAQGKVDAAGKLNDLYKNDAWMKLQLAQLQLEAIKACSDKCTIIIGSSGNIILNGSK